MVGPSGQAVSRRTGLRSRQLIVSAARELFLDRGFSGTGTREIAAAADVQERLIYRHFGGKQQLFDEVARGLIQEFLDDFVAQWHRSQPADHDWRDLTSRYVATLLGFVDSHRRVFADLISLHAGARSQELAAPKTSPFADLLSGLEQLAVVEAGRYQYAEVWAGRNVRSTFSLVVGAALLSDVIYAPADVPADDPNLVAQLTDFILGGALGGDYPRDDRSAATH